MAKKDKEAIVTGEQRDDALFAALGKSRKKKRRRIIITVVSLVLVLAVVGVAGVSMLQRRVREEFAASSGEVLSFTAEAGTISTVVSGSGTLSDVDLVSVSVPAGVEVTEVLAGTYDTVTEGDILATVDMASVMGAMADLQAEIEELDSQLGEAEDDGADDTVTAGAAGRVMALYAAEGDDVADVMHAHGALALISLDGYLAADVAGDALQGGDSVTVRLPDGGEVTGTVETAAGGTATVLIGDEDAAYGDTVTVLDARGTEVGTGELYIHSMLRVTGYAGTVEKVAAEVGDELSASGKLYTLVDTAYSANYNSLLRTRSEKEATLLELLTIQRNGAVLAPMSGSVYSVDYDEATVDAAAETALVTLSADEKMSVTVSVDEADILSLELGQSVTVSVSSVSEDAFVGTLTEINRTASSSGTYSAVVEVEKAEGMLSGMTAGVSVQIEGVENAVLIPIEALHLTANGAYVYTRYDEELQEYGGKVDVVTGLENSTYVEIKSGLQVGDTVYYTEQESVFGGFGGFGGMGGGMPDFGGEMPDFGGMGGGMPDFGGEMPDFGGMGGGRRGGN